MLFSECSPIPLATKVARFAIENKNNILVKSWPGDSVTDYLFLADGTCQKLFAKTLREYEVHGTGCALSTLIACAFAVSEPGDIETIITDSRQELALLCDNASVIGRNSELFFL